MRRNKQMGIPLSFYWSQTPVGHLSSLCSAADVTQGRGYGSDKTQTQTHQNQEMNQKRELEAPLGFA